MSARYALAWSGGKDSTLALHRAWTRGLEVTHLFNLYDDDSGRVPFHGVRGDVVGAQAEALGLELVQMAVGRDGRGENGGTADGTSRGEDDDASAGTAGSSGEEAGRGNEPDDFEAAFLHGLELLGAAGVEGIVFGNIHLEDVRAWYEERVRGRGLDHVEPLWGGDPAGLARQFVFFGYRGRIVSVDLERGDPEWLGRELDVELLEEIRARPDVDPCGEHGEFHSFVWDGPLFRRPVRVRTGDAVEMKGHRLLDLEPTEEDPR